jgi:hypothetical protein
MDKMSPSSADREKLKTITVRLPRRVYCAIRDHAANKGVSMNAILSGIITEYAAKTTLRGALERIRVLQERQKERSGPTSDSVELLREMRAARSWTKWRVGKVTTFVDAGEFTNCQHSIELYCATLSGRTCED